MAYCVSTLGANIIRLLKKNYVSIKNANTMDQWITYIEHLPFKILHSKLNLVFKKI